MKLLKKRCSNALGFCKTYTNSGVYIVYYCIRAGEDKTFGTCLMCKNTESIYNADQTRVIQYNKKTQETYENLVFKLKRKIFFCCF